MQIKHIRTIVGDTYLAKIAKIQLRVTLFEPKYWAWDFKIAKEEFSESVGADYNY